MESEGSDQTDFFGSDEDDFTEDGKTIEEVKIVFIGENISGVTTLIENVQSSFELVEKIEDDCSKIKINEKEVLLSFCHTDGKEMFRSLTTTFFKCATVVFLVFQTNESTTSERLSCWSKEVNRYADSQVPLKLLGITSKEVNEDLSSSLKTAKEFAEENLLLLKTIDPTNVQVCVDLIATEIEHSLKQNEMVMEPETIKKKGSNCCVVM